MEATLQAAERPVPNSDSNLLMLRLERFNQFPEIEGAKVSVDRMKSSPISQVS